MGTTLHDDVILHSVMRVRYSDRAFFHVWPSVPRERLTTTLASALNILDAHIRTGTLSGLIFYLYLGLVSFSGRRQAKEVRSPGGFTSWVLMKRPLKLEHTCTGVRS